MDYRYELEHDPDAIYSPRAELPSKQSSEKSITKCNSMDMVIKTHCKEYKSEYDHEYAGGRLWRDPKNPDSMKRWYIPTYDVIHGRGENNMKSAMSFIRRGKITGVVKRPNFNRYKRIPHPLGDGLIDPEHPVMPYTEPVKETSYTIRPVENSVKVVNMINDRPNSSRPYMNNSQVEGGLHNRRISDQYRSLNNVKTMPYTGADAHLNKDKYNMRYNHPENMGSDAAEFFGHEEGFNTKRNNTEGYERIENPDPSKNVQNTIDYMMSKFIHY